MYWGTLNELGNGMYWSVPVAGRSLATQMTAGSLLSKQGRST